MKKNIVFLPCRRGSERVKNKNTKEFAGIPGGLLKIKLSQLLGAKLIDEIIVSSDDELVMDIACSLGDSRIHIDRRPQELALSSTTTDALIKYVATLIEEGTVIWTHVTSPFVQSALYDNMIDTYYKKKDEYDSLMTVSPLRTFIWNENNAINYDRSIEKWPRTQTISPLFEVNSGAFIADAEIYRKLNDRIGKKVYMYEMDFLESFDIDWPKDFELAELLYRIKYEKI